ncbi:UNVERIFIED_CONTAM: hypothetical protein PYX00_000284 [Menopon gallinae]|uniref:Clr5 domain-containing protein n=1 Tax=Menopon gallinae TaxID=328185 RepID=A0AAW2I9C4_9NEOP
MVEEGDAAVLVRYGKGLTTWRKLKNELMAEFQTKTSVAEIHKLLMRTKKKPEETEESYLMRKRASEPRKRRLRFFVLINNCSVDIVILYIDYELQTVSD